MKAGQIPLGKTFKADVRSFQMLTTVDEFKPGVPGNQRARTLTSEDFLERLSDLFLRKAAVRQGYRLTSKGKSLLPVLAALRDWGLMHIKGTEARMKPVV
jgi:hypothetical protein